MFLESGKAYRSQNIVVTYEIECSAVPKFFNLTACSNTLDKCKGAEGHRCGDGSCIPLASKCDRKYDCADYSDEKNCRKLSAKINS